MALPHAMRKQHHLMVCLKVLDDWTKAVDARLPVDVIHTDFQKAFDSVPLPHGGLLQKLTSIGIKGKLHAWIQSFLLNRKTSENKRLHVRVDGCVKWCPSGKRIGTASFYYLHK